MQVRVWCLLLVLATCTYTYDYIDQFVDELLLSRPEVRQLLVEVVRQQQRDARQPEQTRGRSLARAGDTEGRFLNSLLFGSQPSGQFLQDGASFLQNVNTLDQRRCIPRLLCSAVSGIFSGFGGSGGTATPAPPVGPPSPPTVSPPAPPTARPPAPPSIRPPAPPTARPLPPAPPTRTPAPPTRPPTRPPAPPTRPGPPIRPPSPPTRPPAPPTRPPAPPTRPPAPPTRPPAPPTRPPAPPTRPPAPPTRPPAPPTRPPAPPTRPPAPPTRPPPPPIRPPAPPTSRPQPPAPPTPRPFPVPPVVRPPAPPVTSLPSPPVVRPPAPPRGQPPAPPVGAPAPPVSPPAPPSNALRLASEPFFEKPFNTAAFGPGGRSLDFSQPALFDPTSRRVSLFAGNTPILADDFGLTPVESRHSSSRRGRNELSGSHTSSPRVSGRVLFIDPSGPSGAVAGLRSRSDPAVTPVRDVFYSGRSSASDARRGRSGQGQVSGRIRFEDDVISGRRGEAADIAASSVEFGSFGLPSGGRRALRQATRPPSSGWIRFPERRRKKRTVSGFSGFLRVLNTLAQPFSFSPYTTAAMEGSTAGSRQDCARLYPQCPASPGQGGSSDFIDIFNNLNRYAPGVQDALLSAAVNRVPALDAFRRRYR